MSFFKDLKEDIAQSVDELTETFAEEDKASDVTDVTVEDFPEDVQMPDVDGIEEPAMMFTKPAEELDIPSLNTEPVMTADEEEDSLEKALAYAAEVTGANDIPQVTEEIDEPVIPEMVSEPVVPESIPEPAPIPAPIPEPVAAAPEPEIEMPVVSEPEPEPEMPVMETPEPEPVMEETMSTPVMEEVSMTMNAESMEDIDVSTDEVTVITKGTTINGGIKSDTSLVVKGTIEGDVDCAGKLTITGRVAGNTNASEIYVNTPRLEGDLNSKGIVKIDVGTVVIGGISSTSVVVAGAVKGNIEVNGPVIIDSTAVVKGDIKAKSIQINSGAVIDGHCSLQFADVDLDTFFE